MIEYFEEAIINNNFKDFKSTCDSIDPFAANVIHYIYNRSSLNHQDKEKYLSYIIKEKSYLNSVRPLYILEKTMKNKHTELSKYIINNLLEEIDDSYIFQAVNSYLINVNESEFFDFIFSNYKVNPNDDLYVLERAISQQNHKVIDWLIQDGESITYNAAILDQIIMNSDVNFLHKIYPHQVENLNDIQLSVVFRFAIQHDFLFDLKSDVFDNLINNNEKKDIYKELINQTIRSNSINYFKKFLLIFEEQIKKEDYIFFFEISILSEDLTICKFLLNDTAFKNMTIEKPLEIKNKFYKKILNSNFFKNMEFLKNEKINQSLIRPFLIKRCVTSKYKESLKIIASTKYFLNFYSIKWINENVKDEECKKILSFGLKIRRF